MNELRRNAVLGSRWLRLRSALVAHNKGAWHSLETAAHQARRDLRVLSRLPPTRALLIWIAASWSLVFLLRIFITMNEQAPLWPMLLVASVVASGLISLAAYDRMCRRAQRFQRRAAARHQQRAAARRTR